LILLVDFAHTWAENWIEKHEASQDEDRRWWWIMLISTIVLYTFSLAATIVMAVFFARNPTNCVGNVMFLLANTVLCFMFSFGSIHPRVQESNPKSGLLQAAFLTGYSTYLVFSGMMSDTGECNPWVKSAGANNVSLIIGAVFTIVAVCYTTIRAANQVGSNEEEKAPLTASAEEKGEKTDAEVEKDAKEAKEDASHVDPDEPVTYSFSKFHLIFALGTLYIAMLMSDWRVVYRPGEDTAQIDSGLASVWVKIVSSWLCNLLYIWTLAGPVLFPDRDWS